MNAGHDGRVEEVVEVKSLVCERKTSPYLHQPVVLARGRNETRVVGELGEFGRPRKRMRPDVVGGIMSREYCQLRAPDQELFVQSPRQSLDGIAFGGREVALKRPLLDIRGD
jgi:hypothetical protein